MVLLLLHIPYSMLKMFAMIPESSNLHELVLVRKIRLVILSLVIGVTMIIQLILSLLIFTTDLNQSRIYL